MGKVYYNMGLLGSAEVVETSATDFIGQYIGHTGPRARRALESGLGKVLFIDEAYRLADGHFAKEAMDELVDCITKPKFAQKLIIILAGYDADINHLMSINPGLTSRFPESIQFNSLTPAECVNLLTHALQRKKDLQEKGNSDFDLSCIECPEHEFSRKMARRFERLSNIANWANARDVETLAKAIFGETLQTLTGKTLVLSEVTVLTELAAMINERANRQQCLPSRPQRGGGNMAQPDWKDQSSNPPSTQRRNQNSLQPEATTRQNGSNGKHQLPEADPRDAGVTDEVWDQLQRDKAAAAARENQFHIMKENEEKQAMNLQRIKDEVEKARKEVENAQRTADEDAKKRHEQARLRHELERRKQEEVLAKIRKEGEAMEERRRKEQRAQETLRKMGVCPVGYRWIKQAGGYRCAGGSHWVTDAQLGL